MLNIAQVIGLIKRFGSGGSSSSGGSSVQPDWNQNDPAAADYVKNRTHSYTKYDEFDFGLDPTRNYNDQPNLPDGATITRPGMNNYQIVYPDGSWSYDEMPIGAFFVYDLGGREETYEIKESDVDAEGNLSCSYTSGCTLTIAKETGAITVMPLAHITGSQLIGCCPVRIEYREYHPLDPKYLPPDITIPSGGSLTLAAGATVNDEAGVLGGAGGAFVVKLTWNEDGTIATDKTYDETYAAFKAGKTVIFDGGDEEKEDTTVVTSLIGREMVATQIIIQDNAWITVSTLCFVPSGMRRYMADIHSAT